MRITILSGGVEELVQLMAKNAWFIHKEAISDEIEVTAGSESYQIEFTEEQLPKLCSVITDLRFLA
jgi:hypothetical protein